MLTGGGSNWLAAMNIRLPQLPGNEWYVNFKTKQACYGKRHRIDVGGKRPGAEDNKAMSDKRAPESMEPFAFHSYPLDADK